VTGPHSWTRLAYSSVYAVMDGRESIALFDTPVLAAEWIQQQRNAADPGDRLRAQAFTVEEKKLWHALPDEVIT
jgi:hypothetical protein